MYEANDAPSHQQAGGAERFESDTQKLVHRHLKDKDHVITEDEIKNIRVGMTPQEEALESSALLEQENGTDENKIISPDEPISAWDVIEPQNK